ncbi:MAG: carboxymuconolactone decarboxylase family protein [Bacteroidota bacterium]
MKTFTVPTREQVSENNKKIFDGLAKNLGFVPNLFAAFAHSETALSDCLTFQNRKSTLHAKEREVVNLVVSQINDCRYCQSAHTVVGKMNGFSDEQILEIRKGSASFDEKLHALATFAHDVTLHRGKPSSKTLQNFFAAGYNEANLIDVIILIGEKTISNLLYGVMQFPIDFPLAPQMNEVFVN